MSRFLTCLAGPDHVAILPSQRKERAIGYRFSQPRVAALAQIRVVEDLLAHGQEVIVLPPRLTPNPWYLQDMRCGNDIATLAEQEALHLQAACHGFDALTTANAHFFRPEDSDTGRWQIHVANHGNCSWGPSGNERRLATYQWAFGDIADVHPALPGQAGMADAGAGQHLRLSANGRHLHVFAYLNRYGLGSNDLPRKIPPHTDAEAQRAVARRVQLTSQTSLFVRHHWSGPDAGVYSLGDLVMAGPGVLIAHDRAFASQHQLYQDFSNLVPGIHLLNFSEKWCTTKTIQAELPLGGVFMETGQGLAALLPEQALGRRSGTFWQGLVDQGVLAGLATVPWDFRLFGAGFGRVFTTLPASKQQLTAPEECLATVSRCDAWRRWAETLPAELLPKDIGTAAHAELCQKSLVAFPGGLAQPLTND